MKNLGIPILLSLTGLMSYPAMAQTITGGSCSAASLKGTYSLNLTGRNVSGGSIVATFQGAGSTTFDGASKVTLTGTDNTNTASGQPFTYSGTYTVASTCLGTVTLTQGSSATFTLVAWSNGRQYNMNGTDGTLIYSGNGTSSLPAACATATLSGPYGYSLTGPTLSGSTETGNAHESGVLQFDGQGNATATFTLTTSAGTSTPSSSSGTYTVSSNCQGTATLKDSGGKSYTYTINIAGNYGDSAAMIESGSGFLRSGQLRSAFTNPTESIANVASYAVNATPAGSVFVLFGTNIAPRSGSPTQLPLPGMLQGTSVTVNGETAPLFYVDTQQIDAQMPWDIPGNTVATVIVKSSSGTSNAAAVYVTATATPGLSVISGTNRAALTNKDGTVNTPSNAAAVGDEVTAYFTGGGPVNAAGKLTSGAASPAGLSPVTDANASVTVGGMSAQVKYIGLTPGGVGLYQANFIVPNLAKGSYPVVITISGQASNTLGGPNPNPVMNISN